VEGLQGFLLQVEVSEIMMHEADEPNAIVDFLVSEPLAGQHGGDVDPFATHDQTLRSQMQRRAIDGSNAGKGMEV
jgi:hypothetical protein